MDTHPIRISAVVLVIAVSLPVGAAAGEPSASPRHRGLTINGQSLSTFLGSSGSPTARFPFDDLLSRLNDPISGEETQEADTPENPTGSFAILQTFVGVGDEIKVRHEGGRPVRGKVVSISDSELVVARLQYPFPSFRSRKEQVFAKDVVESVDAVDSVWNGALLGMAAGTAVLIRQVQLADRRNQSPGFAALLFGIPAVVVGAGIGGGIDLLLNQTIYRRSQTHRIAISPWLGRDQKGVMARVRF